MSVTLHEGLRFPSNYNKLVSAKELGGHSLQWALGALVYHTRCHPVRWVPCEESSALHGLLHLPMSSPSSPWQASGAVIQCCRVAPCPQHGRTLREHVPHSHAPSLCHCHTGRLCLLADAACTPTSRTYNLHQSTLLCNPLQNQKFHQFKTSCLMARSGMRCFPTRRYLFLSMATAYEIHYQIIM